MKTFDNMISEKLIDNIICENRIYQCQCGFVGREQAAEEHQLKCELPMEQIT